MARTPRNPAIGAQWFSSITVSLGTAKQAIVTFPSTTIVLAITTLVTVAQFIWPLVFDALRRTPGALEQGEWWRTVTPLFVHAYGWPHLIFNVAWIGAIGVAVERRFGHVPWLLLYFVAGIVGEFAGFAWEPHGGGASLGGSGLLGAFAVWLLLHRPPIRWRIRWWGLLIILGGVALTLLRDIHGPPTVVGGLLGLVMLGTGSERNPALGAQ